MEEKEIKKDMVTTPKGIMQNSDPEYVRLVTQISGLWKKVRKLINMGLLYVRFPKFQTVSGQFVWGTSTM